MSIANTYQELLLREQIQEQLRSGSSVSATSIANIAEDLIQDSDLSIPQFVAANYYVTSKASASAALQNNTVSKLKQDLTALYRDMIRMTRVTVDSYERWVVESSILEKKLLDLESRIEELLLLTQDIEGYYAFVVDNFTDTSLTDSTQTTVMVDTDGGIVRMMPDTAGSTRIFLEELTLTDDVSFRIRSTQKFTGRTESIPGDLTSIFKQNSTAWWTSIAMKEVNPVTCELTIRLNPSGPINLTRIIIDLHESAQSGPVTITPLYSTDNINFSQLPTVSFSQEVRRSTTFSFAQVSAQWIKFILTRIGPDSQPGDGTYHYQFGFKSISFWQEAIDISAVQTFVSTPLYATNSDGGVIGFERVVLDTCDKIETNTSIRYYITVSNDSLVPVNASTLWIPISPLDETTPLFTQVLNVGEITEFVYGDTESDVVDSEVLGISYDGTATTYINPESPFTVISNDGTGGLASTSTTASAQRYLLLNEEDRILNYQIETDVDINLNTLQVFRNIGKKGLDNSTSSQVRDTQRGWKFEDPWYNCIVLIKSPSGMDIDVGSSPIIIDDISYTGKIGVNILNGLTSVTTGLHTIKVHKNNWKYVTNSLTTLAALQAADPLYPFNHKLLIEGYDYNTSYPSNEAKIYTGVDLFAENLMQRVSIFDLQHNVASNDYTKYALDLDAPDTHTGDNSATTVFLVKVNNKDPDFISERYVIKFELQNQLRQYLRLRADFTTLDPIVSPVLDSYRVRLA